MANVKPPPKDGPFEISPHGKLRIGIRFTLDPVDASEAHVIRMLRSTWEASGSMARTLLALALGGADPAMAYAVETNGDMEVLAPAEAVLEAMGDEV